MKVNIIYYNLSISTQLNKGIQARDLISNLKSIQGLKQMFKTGDEVRLLDEKYNFIEDDEFIKVDKISDSQSKNLPIEKKFYLIVRNIFSEKTKIDTFEPKLEINEMITKVTDAKNNLIKNKPSKKSSLGLGADSRIQLIQQLANNFSNLPNIPGLQNRVNEINHFTNLLRSMINDELINGDVHVVNGSNRVPQQIQPVVADEQMLNQLKDMGFPEENCRRALVLARNNISRATDLLINDDLDYINNDV